MELDVAVVEILNPVSEEALVAPAFCGKVSP